jgi:hypothetical protein
VTTPHWTEVADPHMLTDVFVRETGIKDWQALLDALAVGEFRVEYSRSSEPQPVPKLAGDAFPEPGWCDRLLSVHVGGSLFNFHFVEFEMIECDVWLRDQTDWEEVMCFMRFLSHATGKPSFVGCTTLSPSGHAFAAYDPTTDSFSKVKK